MVLGWRRPGRVGRCRIPIPDQHLLVGLFLSARSTRRKRVARARCWTTEAAPLWVGDPLPPPGRSLEGPSSAWVGTRPPFGRSVFSPQACVAGPVGRELGGDQGSGLVLWLLWVAKVYFCEFDWMGLYWMGLKQFVIGRNLF